jgi:hypothetical protein
MSEIIWRPFQNGATLAEQGSEQGETVLDEEHMLGARITLERNTSIAPFAITCGIYGWMVHTRYFETEREARSQYDNMKHALSELISAESETNFEDSHSVMQRIESFVETYP